MSTILPVRNDKAVVDVGVTAGHATIVRLLLNLLLLSLLGLLLLMLLLLGLLLSLLSLLGLLGLLSLLSLLLLGLLLLLGCRSSCLVCVLLLVMAGLLVHPGRIRLGIELVVAVDVRGWHHPGGFGGVRNGPTVEGRMMRSGGRIDTQFSSGEAGDVSLLLEISCSGGRRHRPYPNQGRETKVAE